MPQTLQGATDMKIYCLVQIANEYDQPNNDLLCWWRERPTIEVILEAIGGSLSEELSVLCACALLLSITREGSLAVDAQYNNTQYRIFKSEEGVLLS